MILDSHMNGGEMPLFDVAIEREGLPDEMPEHGIGVGLLGTPGRQTRTRIREAVKRVGPDRVTHGSDAPFHHPSVVLTQVRVSGPPTELTERVLGENGPRLFLGEGMPEAVA